MDLPSEKYHLSVSAALSIAESLQVADPDLFEKLRVDNHLHRLLAQKIAEVCRRTERGDSQRKVVELDVYVFHPSVFQNIVREEALRLLNDSRYRPPAY
jgi:hypothetical protein